MIRNFIFYSLMQFVLFSCQETTHLDPLPRKSTNSLTLTLSDTLVIPVGFKSNVYSRYLKKCIIDSKPYLGVVNEGTNEIEFYGLTDDLKKFKINFNTEGPNGIGKLMAFELISDSTLLIAGTYRVRLWITDFEGNILKTLKTDLLPRKGKPFNQIYYTRQPLMVDRMKNDSYVFTRVDTDYSSPGQWSGTMFLKISDQDSELSNHVFELPSHFNDYVHGAYFCHSSHLLINNRYLVLGIPFYNNLMVLDTDKNILLEKAAGSNYFGDALPWPKPDNEGDEEFYVTSNSYRELAYDEENKLLYRLAYRGVDYTGPDGLRQNWDNKPPSIIILNSDFEKVGEVDLPVNTIYTRMYFTHNGKLYLSLNHPDNNPSEDQMVFVGFRPEKL